MKKTYATIFKWLIYSLILLIVITLQSTPTFMSLGGFRAVFVIPFTVCVAMVEGDLSGAIFACAAGFVWDVVAGRIPGFSSLMLMLLCFGCAIAVAIYIRASYRSCILLSAAVTLIYGLVEFVFFYALFGYENVALILLQKTLPQVVSSAVVAPLIFFAVKRIHTIDLQQDS